MFRAVNLIENISFQKKKWGFGVFFFLRGLGEAIRKTRFTLNKVISVTSVAEWQIPGSA